MDFEIGAHSDSHPHFQQLTVEEQKNEIATSVKFVRALGVPCHCFAFPFDDRGVPATVFEYQTELGIALSFGTQSDAPGSSSVLLPPVSDRRRQCRLEHSQHSPEVGGRVVGAPTQPD